MKYDDDDDDDDDAITASASIYLYIFVFRHPLAKKGKHYMYRNTGY